MPAPSPPCSRCATTSSRRSSPESTAPAAAASPPTGTIDRDYETLRIGMQTLFHDLGITTPAAAAA